MGPTLDPRPSALSSADAAAGVQQHLGLVQAPPCLQCSVLFCQAMVPKGEALGSSCPFLLVARCGRGERGWGVINLKIYMFPRAAVTNHRDAGDLK